MIKEVDHRPVHTVEEHQEAVAHAENQHEFLLLVERGGRTFVVALGQVRGITGWRATCSRHGERTTGSRGNPRRITVSSPPASRQY